ncbi:MAG: flagellar hook assembly protein FlgD [Marivibrio sp.]|uniref:flagellar hook assembly protein FlgD n=1 Tax=Marivibrio sp. TaxID=2039719 RepID=UPI0032EFFB81
MDASAINPFGAGGTTAKQEGAITGLAENFDNFLTILTTQLQNQDPLSPMDTHEFTNQLVAFADVEQSVRQSGQLDDLIGLNRANEAMGAVSYIGQTITADHNEFNFDGETPAELTFTLPETAASAALQIYNAAGNLVAVQSAPKEFGEHTVTWDGRSIAGQSLPAGPYSFQIGAVNADEKSIQASYKTRGAVTGVDYSPEGATLKMGEIAIPLSRVLSVEETAGG